MPKSRQAVSGTVLSYVTNKLAKPWSAVRFQQLLAISFLVPALASALLAPDASANSPTDSQCVAGSAVPDPSNNPGLVSDCEILLDARDTLAGTGNLNWAPDRPIGQWVGVTMSGSILRVTGLELDAKGLTGEVPGELGGLDQLRRLSLSSNLRLSGTLPEELGDLTNLQSLDITHTQLTGEIPASFGQLDQLYRLSLHDNELTGYIPSELGNLIKVRWLFLYNNRLNGGVPPEIGNMENVDMLILRNNELTGELPQSLIALRLSALDFRWNSGLCAPVNDTFQVWMKGINRIHGSSCAPIDSATDRSALVSLYKALNGSKWSRNDNWMSERPLREWYGVTSDADGRILELFLSNNRLDGNIPSEIGGLVKLEILSLGGNELTGSIPPEVGELTNLKRLAFPDNQLTGSIPEQLGQLTRLMSMNFWRNQLSGTIPSALGNLSNLDYLNLSDNELSGLIPPELGNLPALYTLDLEGNKLTGEIPAEIGNLESLYWLELNDNQFTGKIPPRLGGLTGLGELDIGSNQLTGEIPPELGELGSLVSLSLRSNQLTGEIPPELGKLGSLTSLNLRSNQLTGGIPPELGELGSLTSLNLRSNQLTGGIPTQFGDLVNLQDLDLASNRFTGEIPMELGRLDNLAILYLSRNQWAGCVPGELRGVARNDLVNLGLPFCDALLSSLTVNPGALFPSFEPNHTDYTIAVGWSRVTIAPTNDHNASVHLLNVNGDPIPDQDGSQPGHQVDFGVDLPAIRIRAVSEDGLAFRTYTIADLGIRYDSNDNGSVDREEVITAIKDYFNGVITREETIGVIKLYFSG